MTTATDLIPTWIEGRLVPFDKLTVHLEGRRHKAVSVFVLEGERVLIQRRALGKYHTPGLWANTCCTHPHWEETVEDCAERRLSEELGFSVPLTRHQTVEYAADVGQGLKEHERVTLFSAQVDSRTLEIAPVKGEVAETRWIGPRELMREVRERPQDFTPWFRIYLQRFPGLSFAEAA